MKKIVISLLTHQIMPNILFCLEMNKADIFLFIYTDKSENALKNILNSNVLPSKKIHSLKIDATNIIEITETLSNSDFDTNDKYFINLTGGTKIMSIAFYKYFNNFPKVSMYYLDKVSKTYQKIHPYPTIPKKHTYNININEYLYSHGIEILERKSTLVRPIEYTNQYLIAFTNNLLKHPSRKGISSGLRSNKIRDDNFIIIEEIHKDAYDFLLSIDFIEKHQKTITKEEKNYLKGGWLEEFAYNKVKSFSKHTQDYLVHNLQIKKDSLRRELDVFFMHKNTPYYIECKTAVHVYNDAIYKQHSLSTKLGLDLRNILFVLNDNLRDHTTGNLKRIYSQAAKQYNIEFIDRNGLINGDFDQLLYNIFK